MFNFRHQEFGLIGITVILCGCGPKKEILNSQPVASLTFSTQVCRSSRVAVLSEDRKHLAINDPSGVITLTAGTEYIEIRTYNLGQYNPYEISISPDGRYIIGTRPTGSDPGRIFLIDQFRESWTVDGLRAMAWTPDDPFEPYFTADGKHVYVADYTGRFIDVYSIPDLERRDNLSTGSPQTRLKPNLSPDSKLELVKVDQQWGVKSTMSTVFLPDDSLSNPTFLTNYVVCGRQKESLTFYNTSGKVLFVVKITDRKAHLVSAWGSELPADWFVSALAEK